MDGRPDKKKRAAIKVGQQDILEINGKQYDANSGTLLGESRIQAVPRAHKQGRVVDGFVRPAAKAGQISHSHALAGKNPSAQHHPVSTLKAHQPERPQTLMRRVVHKPDVTMKPALKATIPSGIAPRTASDVAIPLEKKLSASQINPLRLAHAKQIAKSHHIRRFSKASQRSAFETATSAAISVVSSPRSSGNQTPMRTAPQMRPTTSPSKSLQLASQRLASVQRSDTMFAAALARADSHERVYRPNKSHGTRARVISITAGVAALFVFGAFIAYLNMPTMEVKLASMHAGFQAEIPGYKPNGYALGNGIESSAGQVALTYHNGKSSYSVTQVASTWDSSTLLDQSINTYGSVPTQTVQSDGRIIYIYKDTAEWVNAGVKYTVNGNGQLSEQEMVSLADSL